MTDQLDVRLAMERAAIRRDFARAHAKVQAWAPRPLPRRKP